MIIEQQLHKLKDVSFSLKNTDTLDSFKAIDIDRIMYIFGHLEAVIGKTDAYIFQSTNIFTLLWLKLTVF